MENKDEELDVNEIFDQESSSSNSDESGTDRPGADPGVEIPQEHQPGQDQPDPPAVSSLISDKDIEYVIARISKIEQKLNDIMQHQNDIEKLFTAAIKKGNIIYTNQETLIAREGLNATIYKMSDTLSYILSIINTSKGNVNISRLDVGKCQELLDDCKERIKKE